MVIGAQLLVQRDELTYFLFERLELRVHTYTIISKVLLSQHLTLFFECGLISGPWTLGYNYSVVVRLALRGDTVSGAWAGVFGPG